MPPNYTAFHDVTFIAYGMFFWDHLITLWLEWYIVSGKQKLRWPLIPYFLTRYSALGFVIGNLLFSTPGSSLNCDALYLGGRLLGKVAVACASVNLLVRTLIIWEYRWHIVLLLGMLVSGQAVLICVALGKPASIANWDGESQSCIVTPNSEKTDLGIFAPYALGVDCIILVLTVVGLRKLHPGSDFAGALIRQGLGFFLLVLFCQTLVTVTVFADGNPVAGSIASVLCAVTVPMVSCHMVRSILGGSHYPAELRPASQGSPTADTRYCRRDWDQFTTHVELGSTTSE